jgi:hypothetical protein
MADARYSSPPRSLAQLLYQASPLAGWGHAWYDLTAEQQRWWQAYADIATSYLEQSKAAELQYQEGDQTQVA